MKELEQAILDIIEDLYERKYVGKLSVSKISNGYKLSLGLNRDKPISIACSGNEQIFLQTVREFLRKGRFHTSDYFTAYQNQNAVPCILFTNKTKKQQSQLQQQQSTTEGLYSKDGYILLSADAKFCRQK